MFQRSARKKWFKEKGLRKKFMNEEFGKWRETWHVCLGFESERTPGSRCNRSLDGAKNSFVRSCYNFRR